MYIRQERIPPTQPTPRRPSADEITHAAPGPPFSGAQLNALRRMFQTPGGTAHRPRSDRTPQPRHHRSDERPVTHAPGDLQRPTTSQTSRDTTTTQKESGMDAAYQQRVRELRRQYQIQFAEQIAQDTEGHFTPAQLAFMRRVRQRGSR